MRTFVAIVGFVALLVLGLLYYMSPATALEPEMPKQANIANETTEETETVGQAAVPTSAEQADVLATMESRSAAKNQVWVGTFQLVWNDFINELLKAPARFLAEQPVMADELNKQSFTEAELSEDAYYKKWGLASIQLKKEIEQGISQKFNETSDILDQFDWTPIAGKYFLYAMLKKDFQFAEPFADLGKDSFKGSANTVTYFGADNDKQKRSIWVLFYKNRNNFAVRLNSKQDDHVYLYRTDNPGTLAKLYQDMKQEILAYNGSNALQEEDHFKAPMLDLDVTKSFTEITGKVISPNWIIAQAIETIKFKMNESGVELKSEAAVMTLKMSASVGALPRYFDFNARYVVFLAEKGKKPYFALLVEDAAVLQ